VVEQAADGLTEELRVIPAGPAAGRTGLICPAGRARRRSHGGHAGVAGRERPGPFGLIVAFIRPRPATEAGRQIAPGPRVRLGLSQRLGRPPDAVRPPPAVSRHG
jgi:hypothetical protein